MCARARAYIYSIVHNRAIQLCHPSHSLPLALTINDIYYENLCSDATKGAHSLYLYTFYLSLECLMLPSLLACYSLDYLVRQLLLNCLSCLRLSLFPPSLARFPTTLVRFLAFLHISFVLPMPSSFPSPFPFPSPLPFPSSSFVRPPVWTLVPVPIFCTSTGLHPRSRPVPGPSPFPFCVRLLASTPRSRPHPHHFSHPQPRPRSCLRSGVCVCVCLCVFIKLHITARSGPVILVILCVCV